MRIVDWAEFQALPLGTIFQEVCGNGGHLGDLMILGEVWSHDGVPRDFIAADLLPAVYDTSQIGDDALEAVGLPEQPYQRLAVMPSGFGRDGLFEYDRTWLIWDETDRARLAAWLLDPAEAAERQNDNPHAFAVLKPGNEKGTRG